MKKFFGILSGIIYILSANALVHANSMGFFSHDQMTTSHCHTVHNAEDTEQPNNNIDCCELVYSNEYYTSQINIKNFCNQYFSFVAPQISKTIPNQEFKILSIVNGPPGWKTDNKYNNFSDLVGIITKLI